MSGPVATGGQRRDDSGRRRFTSSRQRRAAIASAVALALGALAMACIALYPVLHPGVPPDSGPILGAALALAATIVVLVRPHRLSFGLGGAAGVFAIGAALTSPPYLAGLSPLFAASVVASIAAIVASVIGWQASAPIPEAPPRWPTHHELG